MLTRDDVTVLNTDLPNWRGQAWHIQIGDRFYAVSAVDLDFPGLASIPGHRDSETMAFRADNKGNVIEWGEIGFVPYKDHEACITDLLDYLNHIIDAEIVEEPQRELPPGGDPS